MGLLGGGRYNVMNVARSWTQAWEIIKGVEIPDSLPQNYVNKHRTELGQNLTLSDLPYKMNVANAESVRKMASSVVNKIKETVFPLLDA